ncbi:MAG: MerR family transcriptional regulator [Candidatus Omnitrophica bacterium]|nr:MerR family transcriptional regulator [Candidatus Omnitrophota bacterium]
MTTPFASSDQQNDQNLRLYSVSHVAKTVEISQRQLYYWEYLGIVKPSYEQFGSYSYRRYSQEHINLLTKIKTLLDEGYTLRAAVRKVKEQTGLLR